MAKGLEPRGDKKLMGYDPLHGEANPNPKVAGDNRQAGYGPTDGVQSEASVSEAADLLRDDGGRSSDFDVRTTATKARFSKSYYQG